MQPQIGGVNMYQYNGIELNDDFGLDWNMAFYRSYDASIGRWGQVDPLAEKYIGMSPYTGMGNNPITYSDVNGDSTYLVIYGSSWYRPEAQRGNNDVGDGFKKNAEARAKEIMNREGYDPERDAVVILYTPTEDAFLNAVNTEYESGKIIEAHVYAHGTANDINLGGESTDTDKQQDKRWLGVVDDAEDGNMVRYRYEEEFSKINTSNFEEGARVCLWGCNMGGNDANSLDNPAEAFLDQLPKGGTVRAFVGGGAESKQKNGKNYYDGTMIRSADRKSQRTKMKKFTSSPRP